MHKPLPPGAIVSPNGNWIGCNFRQELTLFETASQKTWRLPLPAGVNLLAFSPDRNFFTLSGENRIYLGETSNGRPEIVSNISVPVSGRFSCLATGTGGLIVAALVSEAGQASYLFSWRWRKQALEPVPGSEGQAAGPVVFDSMWVDGAGQTVLVQGLKALETVLSVKDRKVQAIHFNQALQGQGQPFLSLLDLSRAGLANLWENKVDPAGLYGVLFPLANRSLGLREKEDLMILENTSGQGWQQAYRLHTGGVQIAVCSPDGRYLATCQTISETAATIQNWHFTDTAWQKTTEIRLDRLGEFPSLAIDDNGHSVLAFTNEQKEIEIFTSQDERMVLLERLSIQTG